MSFENEISERLGMLCREKPGLTKTLRDLSAGREIFWLNPDRLEGAAMKAAMAGFPFGMNEIRDAEARLARFAPFLAHVFPETAENHGLIESPLTEIPKMREALERILAAENGGRKECFIPGTLWIKRDSELPIAGSVKARGGIYEVLKHAEALALEAGILSGEDDDYTRLASPEARDFFSRYTVQVGSTGNLGLSIGIMSAAIGFRVIVHMSMDAKAWKKKLLRAHGVTVIEYETDYSEAVRQGRENSAKDPMSYFVDDENSADLFLGYSVAALRLKPQLEAAGISVDAGHPLYVYLPCGIGGAPGGITFGLKQVFGDYVRVFFVEPTQAPCMLLGLATGLHSAIAVADIGLTGKTAADGLAVGRPSGFVGKWMVPLLNGACTVVDERLPNYTKLLLDTEGLFIEPSSAAIFQPLSELANPGSPVHFSALGLDSPEALANATHIVWATGGSLMPQEER